MLQQSEYPLDPHYVETEDGYILTLFRLRVNYTGTKSESDNTSGENETEAPKRPAVLIMHGFLASGTEWFCLPPENSLPLMLAQEGYDCWIGCQRGTRLSNLKAHVKLSTKDKKFWDFCVDDFGYYDIPAFIDYILQSTGQEKIFYVGHSLGTAGFFMAMSARPEYNSKIKAMAALAPAVCGTHCSIFIVAKILAPICSYMGKSKFFYRRSAFQTTGDIYINKFLPCFPKRKLAGWMLRFFSGKYVLQVMHGHQLEPERCYEIAKQSPGGTSMKTLSHVMQACHYDKFQKYDYGRGENLKRYGQPHPPQYQLENVTVPLAIFTSEHDYLLPAQDVLSASKRFKNVVFFKSIAEQKFFHADFMIGRDAHELVYKDVIKVFRGFR